MIAISSTGLGADVLRAETTTILTINKVTPEYDVTIKNYEVLTVVSLPVEYPRPAIPSIVSLEHYNRNMTVPILPIPRIP